MKISLTDSLNISGVVECGNRSSGIRLLGFESKPPEPPSEPEWVICPSGASFLGKNGRRAEGELSTYSTQTPPGARWARARCQCSAGFVTIVPWCYSWRTVPQGWERKPAWNVKPPCVHVCVRVCVARFV